MSFGKPPKRNDPTMPPFDLILGYDDLDTVGLVCAWNGVLENANGADDLPVLHDAELSAFTCRAKVARITDDLFGLDSFGSAADTNKFTVVTGDDLVNRFVEHVGTAVNSRETRECLR
jgi:hypothetical protein